MRRCARAAVCVCSGVRVFAQSGMVSGSVMRCNLQLLVGLSSLSIVLVEEWSVVVVVVVVFDVTL